MNNDVKGFVDEAVASVEGPRDQRIRMREVRPDAIETEQGDTYFLEPVQTSLWQGTSDVFNFTKWSFRQFCDRISPIEESMPPGYVSACGKTLGLAQLQYWNMVHKEKEAFIRLSVLDNGRTTVRAVLSGHYVPIDAHVVGKHLLELVEPEHKVEYAITEEFWHLTFWHELETSERSYSIGFRVMGSEIGGLRNVRFDVLIRFHMGGYDAILPVLIKGQPLATIAYSGNGAQSLGRLDQALARGLQAAAEANEAVEKRKAQELKYPLDEYHELVTVRNLPMSLKGLVTEAPDKFEGMKSKFDLVCVLAKIAGETAGRTRLRIESAAGLYLLTGKIRTQRNRNDRDYLDENEAE